MMEGIANEITEGRPDRLRSWSLKTYGLLAVLLTAVLSITASILTVFEIYGAARIFATATLVSLAVSCVILSIWAIFYEDEDL